MNANLWDRAGVPRRVRGLYAPIDVNKSCAQFLKVRVADDGSESVSPVTVKKQVEWLSRCVQEPYHRPYVMHVGDYQNGALARNAVLTLFDAALSLRPLSGYTSPRWVSLHQGFDTQVPLEASLDNPKPSFLVLDNVFMDSTGVKVEKLRDILAFYSDVPVVVIVPYPDPLAMVKQFRLPANYCLLIKDARRSEAEEEV